MHKYGTSSLFRGGIEIEKEQIFTLPVTLWHLALLWSSKTINPCRRCTGDIFLSLACIRLNCHRWKSHGAALYSKKAGEKSSHGAALKEEIQVLPLEI